MPRACSICTHPHRAQIDAALLIKASVRVLAERYAVGRMALQRHRDQGHHMASAVATRTRATRVSRYAVTESGEAIVTSTPVVTIPEPSVTIPPSVVTIPEPHRALTNGVRADDLPVPVFPSIEQVPCRCDVCQLSPYRLLKYAWERASLSDRERLSAEMMTPEWE